MKNEKGYYMSDQQERAAKAEALLSYEELRQKQALLKSEAVKMAKKYKGLAAALETNPEALTLDLQTLAQESEKLFQLVQDLKTVRVEVQDAHQLVTNLGFRPDQQ